MSAAVAEQIETQVCARCSRELPLTAFAFLAGRKSKRKKTCEECEHEREDDEVLPRAAPPTPSRVRSAAIAWLDMPEDSQLRALRDMDISARWALLAECSTLARIGYSRRGPSS